MCIIIFYPILGILYKTVDIKIMYDSNKHVSSAAKSVMRGVESVSSSAGFGFDFFTFSTPLVSVSFGVTLYLWWARMLEGFFSIFLFYSQLRAFFLTCTKRASLHAFAFSFACNLLLDRLVVVGARGSVVLVQPLLSKPYMFRPSKWGLPQPFSLPVADRILPCVFDES